MIRPREAARVPLREIRRRELGDGLRRAARLRREGMSGEDHAVADVLEIRVGIVGALLDLVDELAARERDLRLGEGRVRHGFGEQIPDASQFWRTARNVIDVNSRSADPPICAPFFVAAAVNCSFVYFGGAERSRVDDQLFDSGVRRSDRRGAALHEQLHGDHVVRRDRLVDDVDAGDGEVVDLRRRLRDGRRRDCQQGETERSPGHGTSSFGSSASAPIRVFLNASGFIIRPTTYGFPTRYVRAYCARSLRLMRCMFGT